MARYTFGPFQLDLKSAELRKNGEEIPLEPRVFSLLVYLLEHRGRLVTRSELIEAIWPDAHVSDASLSQAVALLRDALSDDARDPAYIVTMPTRGYKFVGELTEERRVLCRVTYGGRDYILAPGENIIGRAGDAAVQIDSHRVSRHHARITVGADVVTIEDLGSRNGTAVEGKQIAGAQSLLDGQQVQVGDAVLTFQISHATDKASTAPL